MNNVFMFPMGNCSTCGHLGIHHSVVGPHRCTDHLMSNQMSMISCTCEAFDRMNTEFEFWEEFNQ